MKTKKQLNTADEFRAMARKYNVYAEAIERLTRMRNCEYGKEIDSMNESTGEIEVSFEPWEGQEVEYEAVNELISLISNMLS